MGLIRYRCPATGNEITTSIETGPEILFRMKTMELKIWVSCPHCMSGHQIKAGDAALQESRARPETLAPLRRPGPAPMRVGQVSP